MIEPEANEIEVPCMRCGEKSRHRLGALIDAEEVLCPHCNAAIRVGGEVYQQAYRELLDGFRQVYELLSKR